MPRILGTGLVALDLIVEHYDVRRRVLLGGGGTCGNVLAILARAGWQSSLVGALDESAWSSLMRRDLELAGVETKAVRRQSGATPSLIVEHLARTGEAAGRHWFQLYGSKDEGDWPGLCAAPDQAVRDGAPAVCGRDVFFVDRLSSAVLELAHLAKAQGVTVVYEPSSRHDRQWMADMLTLADVVKYSSERADALGVAPSEVDADLMLVTDGPNGAAWRIGGRTGEWRHQAAVHAPVVVDTCGAGDWFTAGLLMGLYRDRAGSKVPFDPTIIACAVTGASMLAAWSCAYVGARGALYDAHVADFKARIRPLFGAARAAHDALTRPAVPAAYRQEVSSLCHP